jgi:hypothetical protein
MRENGCVCCLHSSEACWGALTSGPLAPRTLQVAGPNLSLSPIVAASGNTVLWEGVFSYPTHISKCFQLS